MNINQQRNQYNSMFLLVSMLIYIYSFIWVKYAFQKTLKLKILPAGILLFYFEKDCL